MLFDSEQIDAIFSKLSIKVNRIVRIKTLSNLMLKIESDAGNYFLKIYCSKREGRTGYKLAHLYPLLFKKGVPVPRVLKFDDSLEIIKYPYLIYSAIEGKIMSTAIRSMNKKQIMKLYYEFGKIVANIHSVTYDKFGETFDGVDVNSMSEIGYKGPYKKWKTLHKQIINHRLSYLKGTKFEDLVEPIRFWFKRNACLIDYNIIPRLLHIDLNKENLILKNNKIIGMIDFDGSFIGHNEEELMRIEGAHFSEDKRLKNAFLEGYKEIIKLDEGYDERRTFYCLSRLLVHIDCMILFGKDYIRNIESEIATAKKEIKNILAAKPITFNKK